MTKSDTHAPAPQLEGDLPQSPWPASDYAIERIEKLEAALARAEEALRPMSDAVFNDNGDMTVSQPLPNHEDCVKAYFAAKQIRAALAAKEGQNDG